MYMLQAIWKLRPFANGLKIPSRLQTAQAICERFSPFEIVVWMIYIINIWLHR